jgi:AraC-like DNA-binding protein
MSSAMMKPSQIPSLVQRILLVDEITRTETGSFRSVSPPGHLIHVVVSGEVRQEAEGRHESLREGSVVWYHEDEPVVGRILRAPWRFITINFTAPGLPPPPDALRVMRSSPRVLELASQLLALWSDQTLGAVERDLRTVIALMHILLEVHPMDVAPSANPVYPINAREKWWLVEKSLRQQLDRRHTMAEIAAMAGMSARTTHRACLAATGLPPARRLHDLRVAHATSLLQHTDLPITEVAQRIGYSRVQEFSRDYRSQTGRTPREARRASPDYIRLRQ